MMSGNILNHNMKIVKANEFGTELADGAYPSTYVDVSNTERFYIVVKLGVLGDSFTIEPKQSATSTGTLSAIDSSLQHDVADTDDGKIIVYTIETRKLDNKYVALSVSGVDDLNTDNFADILFLLPQLEVPVTQESYVVEKYYAG